MCVDDVDGVLLVLHCAFGEIEHPRGRIGYDGGWRWLERAPRRLCQDVEERRERHVAEFAERRLLD